MHYDFNDYLLIPEDITKIGSRTEVTPYIEYNDENYLPLITAPMDTVIDANNLNYFKDNKIICCLPRNLYSPKINSDVFFSFSMEQLNALIVNNNSLDIPNCICIDTANGHMSRIFDLIKELKGIKPNIKIIVGNIANHKTYANYGDLDVWGVRCSIGSGQACLTSQQSRVGSSLPQLVHECAKIKKENGYKTHIIMDGGMKNYSDIIMALAFGADIVMCGGIFNQALEACGDTYFCGIKVNGIKYWLYDMGFKLKRKFRGMSTKEVQKLWGREEIKTSEGISTKDICVNYTLGQWVENFEHYLRNAMSYTNSYTLSEFSESEKMLVSTNVINRFKK